jgi:hypothetical protein
MVAADGVGLQQELMIIIMHGWFPDACLMCCMYSAAVVCGGFQCCEALLQGVACCEMGPTCWSYKQMLVYHCQYKPLQQPWLCCDTLLLNLAWNSC